MSKDKSEVKLIELIKYLELKIKRQKILINWHDEHTCERAISNTKANTLREVLDDANSYLEGLPEVKYQAKKLKERLAMGFYH